MSMPMGWHCMDNQRLLGGWGALRYVCCADYSGQAGGWGMKDRSPPLPAPCSSADPPQRSHTMAREIVALSPEHLEIREVDDPIAGDGQVLIRSEHAAAKHGTETASVKGCGNRGRFDAELQLFVESDAPRPSEKPVGNMIVGSIEAVGSGVDGFDVGDRVTTHSSFRDLHARDASRCWKLPRGMPWQSAVCLDPADFAMGAVRDGNVRVGDAVAVFGMGAIGLMVVQFAKLSGADPVIAIDPLDNRRKAATHCGADLALDPIDCDAGLEIKRATGDRGADAIIEYSGSVHAMQAALRGIAFGGNVVAGAYPPPYGAGLDLGAEAHFNTPNIIFSRACSSPLRDYPRWTEQRIFQTCWRLLSNGTLTGEPIVTPIVPFEEIVTEYPKIMSDPASNVKLGCVFDS